jgi:predicted transcriptional regulator
VGQAVPTASPACGLFFHSFLSPQDLPLLHGMVSRTLKAMEVHFTPEQEAQLAQIATKEGTDAERLVKDAAVRLLEEDARFRAAVREGIAQADRGEFIEEEEMDARLEQMLRS